MSDGISESELQPFAFRQGRVIALEVATSVYSSSAILRTCYKFSDRVYTFISPSEGDAFLTVALWSRTNREITESFIGEFCNDLADQELRERLARETGPIREIIIAQAFAEGDLTGEVNESDYEADPFGVAATR